MFIETKHFGKIEVIEDKIINFRDGLFAFEELKKYIYIENEDTENPFNWLQCVDEPELAFVVTNPYVFVKEYEFDIPEKIVVDLEIQDIKDVMILSIAVVPENIENMTINLKGPIIVNLRNKRAKQMVVNDEKYSLKHKIFEQNSNTGDAIC